MKEFQDVEIHIPEEENEKKEGKEEKEEKEEKQQDEKDVDAIFFNVRLQEFEENFSTFYFIKCTSYF